VAGNYPQCLLADLWITCSSLATGQANQALQGLDQKTTSVEIEFSAIFQGDK
jgi:hypothetical protein